MEKSYKTKIEQLNFLIGNWKTEGEIIAKDNKPAGRISGTDSYEWILDRKFILHKVDVTMGNEKVEAIEIIGEFDEKGNSYKMRSFDNQGAYAEMEGRLEAKGTLHITGDRMRSKLTVIDSNSMSAHWESSEDNKNWEPWMELKLSKENLIK